MRLTPAILTLALLAGASAPASAQAKAPDPAEVARLQKEIAKNQAKGDYQSVSLELRLLARQYKNDPAMLSATYTQLAQVSSQLHDEKKAAEYRALAQSAVAQPGPAPVPAPPAAGSQAPAGASPAKASPTDRFSKILAEAQQIIRQTQQMQQSAKQKGANTPQPDQPIPPPAGGFPAAPDGAAAASAPQPAPAEIAPAAGVVIGYDSNNQPIFAPAPASAPQGPAPPR